MNEQMQVVQAAQDLAEAVQEQMSRSVKAEGILEDLVAWYNIRRSYELMQMEPDEDVMEEFEEIVERAAGLTGREIKA